MRRGIRLVVLGAALLPLGACVDPAVRDQNVDVCAAQLNTLDVEVVDAHGLPAPGAVVAAHQPGTGITFTLVADEGGRTRALSEDVGPGTLQLSATRGAKVTLAPAEVEWACDACNCTPSPAEVRLQLSP